MIPLNTKNISQFYCFCSILDQVNAHLVSRRVFSKNIKNLLPGRVFALILYSVVLLIFPFFLKHFFCPYAHVVVDWRWLDYVHFKYLLRNTVNVMLNRKSFESLIICEAWKTTSQKAFPLNIKKKFMFHLSKAH